MPPSRGSRVRIPSSAPLRCGLAATASLIGGFGAIANGSSCSVVPVAPSRTFEFVFTRLPLVEEGCLQANIRNSRRISGVSVSPRSGRNGARHERSGGLREAQLTREGQQPLLPRRGCSTKLGVFVISSDAALYLG